MSNAQKKKPRFGMAKTKARVDEKAGQVISAVHAFTDPAARENSDLEADEQPPQNQFDNSQKNITTSPRIREQIEISGTFSQKAGVSYIRRFDELAEQRRASKTPPFIKRDLLEEALDYLFEKYA